MMWKVPQQEELVLTSFCCPFMLLSGSVTVFEQIVTVFCSVIVLFLFLIRKASALQKMVCNADTVSCIKLLADTLHLGIIPRSQNVKVAGLSRKKHSVLYWMDMRKAFSPVSLTERNLVLTFCCLWHIL